MKAFIYTAAALAFGPAGPTYAADVKPRTYTEKEIQQSVPKAPAPGTKTGDVKRVGTANGSTADKTAPAANADPRVHQGKGPSSFPPAQPTATPKPTATPALGKAVPLTKP